MSQTAEDLVNGTITLPPDLLDFGEPIVTKPKQVIIVRKDLKMDGGKASSQVAHASLKVFFDRMTNKISNELSKFGIQTSINEDLKIRMTPEMWEWKQGDFKKIVLAVHSEEELLALFAQASVAGLPCSLIQDNGETVFNNVKTYTTAAIGPALPADIDKITGHLKPYR